MAKRYIKEEELIILKNKIEEMQSHATWTAEKYALRDALFSLIEKTYKYDTYERGADFLTLKDERFFTWDYELRPIPLNQRGQLKAYRGKKIFIICTYNAKYGKRNFLLLPLKN